MMRTVIQILIFLTVNLALAQESKKGFSISVKGGLTMANMYGDVKSETFLNGDSPQNFYANSPASSKFKTGINIGLLLDYRFGKYFSMGIGTSYIQKGASINTTESWNRDLQDYERVNGKINWIQNYWTIDVPLTFYLPLKENDFYLQSGLFFGNLLDSEEKGDVEISGRNYSYVNERGANKKEFGFLLGCGYIQSLPKNIGSIYAEFMWSRSLLKSYGRNSVPNPQYFYNQNITINIGYRYNLRFKN